MRVLLVLDAESSQLLRLKEAYFQVWRSAGFGGDLEQAYQVTQQVRPAHGVLQWSRVLANMAEEARIAAAHCMLDWLRAFA